MKELSELQPESTLPKKSPPPHREKVTFPRFCSSLLYPRLVMLLGTWGISSKAVCTVTESSPAHSHEPPNGSIGRSSDFLIYKRARTPLHKADF